MAHFGPMPLSKDTARRLLAAIHGTDRTPNLFHPMFAFVRAHHRALRRSRGDVSGVCVDVGCGDRFYERFYAGSYSRYVGLDYLPVVMIDGKPSRLRGREFENPDVIADGQTLPLKAGIADTLLLIEVLEHIPDPLALLKEAKRILKPGGRLLLTTPFALPEHAQPYDFYRYTQYGLRHLLREAGLRVERVEPITSLGGVIAYFLNMFPIVGTYRAGKLGKALKLIGAPVFLLAWAVTNTWAVVWDHFFSKDGFTLDYLAVATSVGKDA